MLSKSEIKTILINNFLNPMDTSFKEIGFERTLKSLKYVYKTEDMKIFLCFEFCLNPPYNKLANAHIQPRLEIWSSKLFAKSLELLDGNVFLLGGTKDLLVNMPIDFCAPKGDRTRWFIVNSSQTEEVFSSLRSFVEKFVLSVLEKYKAIKSFTFAEKGGDKTLFYQPLIWQIHLISAYILQGDLENAKRIFETGYSKPGQLRKYSMLHSKLT
jgi:hypothetical protein